MHWLTDASPERDARARLGRVATRDGSQYTEPADDALGPGACLAIRCVPLAPQRSRLSHRLPIGLLNLPIASRSLHSVTCTFTFIDRHLPFLLQPFTSLFSPVITVPRDPGARHRCIPDAGSCRSAAAMMSLTPMVPLAWRYYAEEIVRGREDYFAKGAERPGRFLGRGAAALGIADHEAHVRELEWLFGHGADPRTGGPLGRGFDPNNERAVAGFALTFSPPKSVSALWAIGDQPTADQVLAAHDAAVAASLAFLEDHAAFSRRGHNGVLQLLKCATRGIQEALGSAAPVRMAYKPPERPTESSCSREIAYLNRASVPQPVARRPS